MEGEGLAGAGGGTQRNAYVSVCCWSSGATARVGAAHVQHYHTHSCLCRKEMKRESAARSTRVEPQEDGLDGLLHPSPPYWEPHPSLDWRQMARDKGIVEVGAEKALK